MTATILQFKPRVPDFRLRQDHPFREKICLANADMVGPTLAAGLENFVLFEDIKYPGKLLADVYVKPKGLIFGLFYVDPKTLKFRELELDNYRYFRE